mmetsp:Transcript_2880/g.7908  ORF Transcript_2880/g.7908 Transcript_2880/m.7908 type:complete len:216 (+) Transcript_2880:811-1458(+)
MQYPSMKPASPMSEITNLVWICTAVGRCRGDDTKAGDVGSGGDCCSCCLRVSAGNRKNEVVVTLVSSSVSAGPYAEVDVRVLFNDGEDRGVTSTSPSVEPDNRRRLDQDADEAPTAAGIVGTSLPSLRGDVNRNRLPCRTREPCRASGMWRDEATVASGHERHIRAAVAARANVRVPRLHSECKPHRCCCRRWMLLSPLQFSGRWVEVISFVLCW